MALLIRLSLADRHLPSSFSSIAFSPVFSKLIVQFQQRLAFCLLSYPSTLSWTKIVDIFDGRLFAFTLYRLSQSSSEIYFDSNTTDVVEKCLALLKLSTNEDIFRDIVQQLIQSKHIIFSSSSPKTRPAVVKQMQITRISNSFIDTYLGSILSRNDELTLNFVSPDNTRLARYKGRIVNLLDIKIYFLFFIGKHHWHVYKEVHIS